MSLAESARDGSGGAVLCFDIRDNVMCATRDHFEPFKALMRTTLLSTYPDLWIDDFRIESLPVMNATMAPTMVHKVYCRLSENAEPEGIRQLRRRYRDR
jgi:hypothetical protein